ncbi:ATPase [Cantharellus anzutake]|uniref:ATPase n=1 Tax=Cantharellus anzutake TaxID=1750568 RepID=UPI001903BCF9|nr:ATPase [Cantharellus anzutake]KAF8334708.1 ATPase [Cantharellus anzutake]
MTKMSGKEFARKVVLDAIMVASAQMALYYAWKWWMSEDTGPSKSKRNKVTGILERLGKKGMKLSEHEEIIAAEIVHPDEINVNFSDIGGLDSIISSLRESVIYPLLYPSLFTPDAETPGDATKSSLFIAPKGVLLHGPPGCGKTLLARALAKESNATFINVPLSVLTNKWYGESNKLVAALFDLARKLQPSIIFIDEIDCFLRERRSGDHEVTGMMKAEFMTMWDGLLTQSDRILVLGATNRPMDIDAAILRRMPKRFAVGLPDTEQRKRILKLMLPSSFPDVDIGVLAAQTLGLSGSDLKEMCRDAAMEPLREFMRERGGSHEEVAKGVQEGAKIRPLALKDFFADSEKSTSMLALRAKRAAHVTITDKKLSEIIDGLD